MIPDLQLFPITTQYPQFFLTNLNDPKRVIKIVRGNNCGIRAYYYQLFKIVLELQVQRDGQILDYASIFCQKMKQLLMNLPYQSKSRCQVQTLLLFVNELLEKEQTNFQAHINNNQQIDEVIIQVFKEMLKEGGVINGLVEENMKYLCKIFDQRITEISKCIKFHESDVFVYIVNQQLLFLAFMKLEDQPQSNNNSTYQVNYGKQLKDPPPTQDNNKKAYTKTQNDTIINMFGDILSSSKQEGDSKFSNNFSRSLSPTKKEEESILFRGFADNVNKREEKRENNENFMKKYIESSSNQNKFVKDQSKVQAYQIKDQNKYATEKSLAKQQFQADELIYRPPQSMNYSKSSTNVLPFQLKKKKNECHNWVDEEKHGELYRQFTNTKILNMLPQHQRETVKSLKKKFVRGNSHNFVNKI